MDRSELTTTLEGYINNLASATNAARFTEEFTAWLNIQSRFHHYSYMNTISILLTKPGATHVAGFHKWLELHRFVKKGEHGIPILCPCLRKDEDAQGKETSILAGFKVGFVFDISQTEGEPLPEPPQWTDETIYPRLQTALVEIAEEMQITVTVQASEHGEQGSSRGGSILLADTAGTCTLIHELAHEILHQNKNTAQVTRQVQETEAEAVAYTVAKYFGIENPASPNYIALHGATAQVIQSSLQRIATTAHLIITKLETKGL